MTASTAPVRPLSGQRKTSPTPRDVEIFRLDGEIFAARELQRQLQGPIPYLDAIEIAVIFQPANDLSGDFFKVLKSVGGGLVGVVGDVSGHDLSAALAMSHLIGAFRHLADYADSPADILSRLNETLFELGIDRFATALCFLISADGRTFEFGNSGHLPPLLLRPEGSSVVPIAAGAPLGVLRESHYPCVTLQLNPGDVLVLMTDGVAESLDPAGHLDAQELHHALAADREDLVLTLARLFSAFDEGNRGDDATLIAFRPTQVAR